MIVWISHTGDYIIQTFFSCFEIIGLFYILCAFMCSLKDGDKKIDLNSCDPINNLNTVALMPN